MPKLYNISAKQLVKIASKKGFCFSRQSGSHIILKNSSEKILIIPNHKNIKIGTLKQILKVLEIEKHELEKLL